MSSYLKIQQSQELSKQRLGLCNLICKIQVQNQRHFTMENPGSSDMWETRIDSRHTEFDTPFS